MVVVVPLAEVTAFKGPATGATRADDSGRKSQNLAVGRLNRPRTGEGDGMTAGKTLTALAAMVLGVGGYFIWIGKNGQGRSAR